VLEDPDAEPQRVVNRPHPLRVTLGEVVVDRDDVHAPAGQRVEIRRECGHQGLAFAGGHLGDLPLVQHHPADELHVKVPHGEDPPGGLAADGEGFGQDLVQCDGQIAVRGGRRPLSERGCLGAQVVVTEALKRSLEAVDGFDPRLQPFNSRSFFVPTILWINVLNMRTARPFSRADLQRGILTDETPHRQRNSGLHAGACVGAWLDRFIEIKNT